MFQISVIIPSYNHARFIGEAIDSALKQTLPPLEVIVVDDGSSDETPKVLAGYGDGIKVIVQPNQGVAVARNAGAAAATGDLIAFLDSDDVWLPTKLELQAGRFKADPDLGLVHCGYEEVAADGATLSRHLDGMEGWVADEMLLFRRAAILTPGSGAVIPRAVFEEVGGFDPDRRLAPSEDFDLCFRIAERYRVGFVPAVLIRYRQHGNNVHRIVSRMETAMLLIYGKIFAADRPQFHRLRRLAYGNLHMMLAGSFFVAGRRADCARHILKSLWHTPGNVGRVFGYPVRRFSRRAARPVPGAVP